MGGPRARVAPILGEGPQKGGVSIVTADNLYMLASALSSPQCLDTQRNGYYTHNCTYD